MPNPKYKTVAFDSGGELSRLFFSKDMNKHSDDTELIRAMNNYPGATERFNMLIRRLKNLRDSGTEVIFLCHEDIQKTYARGGAMATKGQPPSEPIEVRGQPDFPGNTAPQEIMRVADIIWRGRLVNKTPTMIARKEPLGSGIDYWVSKDRFGGDTINNGMFPADYNKIAELVKKTGRWNPAYIWIWYAAPGFGKTRSLLTFPRPLKLYDLDRGTKSLLGEDLTDFEIESYDVEDVDSYGPLMGSIGKLF